MSGLLIIEELLTQPCQITTRVTAGRNEDFDPIVTEAVVDTVCFIDALGESEGHASGEVGAIEAVAYLLPTTEVSTAAAIVTDTDRWEIVGQPDHVWDPFEGAYSHIRCHVRRDTP